MPLEIKLARKAERDFKKLPQKAQRHVRDAILTLADEPYPKGCERLKGTSETVDLWRIKVGDYRIVYTLYDNELIVLVVRIAHRKDSYKQIMRIVKNL